MIKDEGKRWGWLTRSKFHCEENCFNSYEFIFYGTDYLFILYVCTYFYVFIDLYFIIFILYYLYIWLFISTLFIIYGTPFIENISFICPITCCEFGDESYLTSMKFKKNCLHFTLGYSLLKCKVDYMKKIVKRFCMSEQNKTLVSIPDNEKTEIQKKRKRTSKLFPLV